VIAVFEAVARQCRGADGVTAGVHRVHDLSVAPAHDRSGRQHQGAHTDNRPAEENRGVAGEGSDRGPGRPLVAAGEIDQARARRLAGEVEAPMWTRPLPSQRSSSFPRAEEGPPAHVLPLIGF